jgi:hypothetical protein
MEAPQKISGYTYLKESKSAYYREKLSVYHGTIHNCQIMESVYVPINRKMGKENVVRIHNGVLLNHEQE